MDFFHVAESIHQQFERRVLKKICNFFKLDLENLFSSPEVEKSQDEIEPRHKYPVIWSENDKKPVEMDKLDNLVDTTDGFLMLAFEDFLFEETEREEKVEPLLFEKYGQ